LTEPSSASVNPPCPRLPTTRRSASSEASSSTCAGLPSTTRARTRKALPRAGGAADRVGEGLLRVFPEVEVFVRACLRPFVAAGGGRVVPPDHGVHRRAGERGLPGGPAQSGHGRGRAVDPGRMRGPAWCCCPDFRWSPVSAGSRLVTPPPTLAAIGGSIGGGDGGEPAVAGGRGRGGGGGLLAGEEGAGLGDGRRPCAAWLARSGRSPRARPRA